MALLTMGLWTLAPDSPRDAGLDLPPGSVPVLTAEQRSRVVAIIEEDARLRALLPPAVGISEALGGIEVAPWTDPSGALLGGVATVRLPAGPPLVGEWLSMLWLDEQSDGPKPYGSVRFEAMFQTHPPSRCSWTSRRAASRASCRDTMPSASATSPPPTDAGPLESHRLRH